LPNVEALAARPGFESLEFDIWGGIQVPRRTPAEVIARLHAAVYESLKNPDIRKAYEGAGNTVPDPVPLARLEQLYRAEITRYQAMAKSVNLQTQ
ncbi:MAG TPA: tripartite tricarboxylate transporter substrate-binding protein, partial [Pseudorhodoferax sp.]|nr:tripartite tricarboxylate transporter substrate-binding protein [Pseudorhodoferax sp.]